MAYTPIPRKNRAIANTTKFGENADSTPDTKRMARNIIMVGLRPNLQFYRKSAIFRRKEDTILLKK